MDSVFVISLRSRMKININLFCILLAYSYLCNDYLVCCNNFNYYEETTINNHDGPDARRYDDDGRAC